MVSWSFLISVLYADRLLLFYVVFFFLPNQKLNYNDMNLLMCIMGIIPPELLFKKKGISVEKYPTITFIYWEELLFTLF